MPASLDEEFLERDSKAWYLERINETDSEGNVLQSCVRSTATE